MTKTNLVFILVITFFCSCKKQKEVTPIDTTNLLTNNNTKTWILKDYIQEGKSIIATCAKDDEYTFNNSNNKVTYSPKVKCYESDEEKILDYEFNAEKTVLTINEVEYKIDEVSPNKLVLNHHNTSNLRLSPSEILHQSYILVFGAK
jgi:hypothetical protein